MKRILVAIKFIFTGKIYGVKECYILAYSEIMSSNIDDVLQNYYELEKLLPYDFKLKHASFLSNFFSAMYNNKRNSDIIIGKCKKV